MKHKVSNKTYTFYSSHTYGSVGTHSHTHTHTERERGGERQLVRGERKEGEKMKMERVKFVRRDGGRETSGEAEWREGRSEERRVASRSFKSPHQTQCAELCNQEGLEDTNEVSWAALIQRETCCFTQPTEIDTHTHTHIPPPTCTLSIVQPHGVHSLIVHEIPSKE